MDEDDNTHQQELSTYVSIFNTSALEKVNVQREDTPQAVDHSWENDQQSQILETGGFSPDTAVAETSEQECKTQVTLRITRSGPWFFHKLLGMSKSSREMSLFVESHIAGRIHRNTISSCTMIPETS